MKLPEFQRYINSSEFKNIVSIDINNYVNSSKNINLDDSKGQIIYSSDLNPEFLIKNKITAIINLDKCLKK